MEQQNKARAAGGRGPGLEKAAYKPNFTAESYPQASPGEKVHTSGTHRVSIGFPSGRHRGNIEGSPQSVELSLPLLTEKDVCKEAQRLHFESVQNFLSGAIERNENVFMEHDDAEYRSPCWQLVSELRGHPVFSGCENGAHAAAVLEQYIEWAALPDSDIYGIESDPEAELMDAWNYQVEHNIPALQVMVSPETAVTYAERYPLTVRRAKPAYTRAVSICFWYSHLLMQDGWFFLSARKLGDLLGCSPRIAACHLRRAAAEGLIEVFKDYPKSSRKAREYKWRGMVAYLEGGTGNESLRPQSAG